ncbi:hypothetical protein FOA52_015560 [Chlamydomonas sp. UWO 241]|nr:hypothetical protein FOA52_015560 [Chlamydomonas sp. UWO 241]
MLEGSDQGDRLLLMVSAAFNDADIDVIEATISNEDGFVKDVFKVSIRGGGKVPESLFEDVERRIAVSSLSSSRSSRPAIYGMIAASEVERLRPLSGDAVASDCEVAALELAAAEMAQASAELVAMELDILHMRDKNVGGKVMAMREAKRNECASMLERRISAMKALMATRREASNTFVMDAPAVSSKTADMPSMPAVRTPERFVPAPDGFTPARERLEAAPAREAEGDDEWPRARVPGCAGPGSGYEILFQGFNWESHNYDWYNTLTQQIDAIADAGFTCIWLPPPADSVSPQTRVVT